MNKENNKKIVIKIPQMEITFQPINNFWGILMKSGNVTINEVDTKLALALMKTLKKYSSFIANSMYKNCDDKKGFCYDCLTTH